MLPFRISLGTGDSPFRQIVYAATRAVVSGELSAGLPFPSVRELSQELKINPNTAHKVVAELIRTGLLEVMPGVGTVVSAHWRASSEERERLVSAELERLAVDARRLGLNRAELMDALNAQWDAVFGPDDLQLSRGSALMSIIDVRDLTHRYGKHVALRDVSFSIEAGSMYALLGPNGSGKTTLLQILMGLLPATSGEVRVLGVSAKSLTAAHRARMGYVAEGVRLPSSMTLAQLERYVSPLYPTWDASLANVLRERFQLDASRRIRTLSRGEHMKAAMLCALAPRPELLIMDEPFTGMDAVVKDDLVRGVLEMSGREGWTVVIASHDLAELELLADWVGFLHDGTLQLHEPMETVRQRYRWLEVITSSRDAVLPQVRPAEWVWSESAGPRVRVLISERDSDLLRQQAGVWFPDAQRVEVHDASLRDVFVALTRQGALIGDAGGSAVMRGSMPWARQVWHVFAKDVHRHQWMLLLFAVQALIGVLGLRLLGSSLSSTSYGAGLLYLTLPITAVVLAAMVVLDDAPTSARAWWSSLALSRDAVFGAKLAFVIGLIPLVMLAAVATLQWSFGVRGADVLMLSFRGSRLLVLMVSISFALAALLQDLRSFLLAAVACAVTAMLLGGVLLSVTEAADTLSASHPSWVAYRSIVTVSPLLLLLMTWRVYRSRSRPWSTRGVVLLLIAVMTVGTPAMSTRGGSGQSKRLESVRLSAELGSVAEPGSSQEAFLWSGRVEGLPPDLRGTVHLPPTRFVGGKTCSKAIAFGEPNVEVQSPAPPVPGSPVRWRGPTPYYAFPTGSTWTRTWPARVPAECTPVPRAELHVHEPRFLASIPLADGKRFTRNGYRIAVQNTARRDATSERFGKALVLATLEQVSSIPSTIVRSDPAPKLSYVLLHPGRREAIQVHVDVSSAYSQIGPVSAVNVHLVLSDSLVMPAAMAAPRPFAKSPQTQTGIWQWLGFASQTDFDIWLRGAELVVFEWKLVGVVEGEVLVAGGHRDVVPRAAERVR